ncbi:ASCH domain-containing protein [Burkholderia sp. Bp9004]|uniref:ASCH domain-containing protein n=1 Tax=Burkholderia sp. Bp9004 TaxID=2184559 RepID=UPI0021AB8781|nr:ASCH domain-containing protein [Burkholderia sp. Bp9004]
MPRSALSIVKPAVDDIVAGRKRVEIRSWAPPAPCRCAISCWCRTRSSCDRTDRRIPMVSRSRGSTSWGIRLNA